MEIDRLADQEKQKYEALWVACAEYREVSGARYLTPLFLQFFHTAIRKKDSAIDFGCGLGISAPYLLEAQLSVYLVDVCANCLAPEVFLKTVAPRPKVWFLQACLWTLPPNLLPADWILCFDVLEHLPEEKVEPVLEAMAAKMKKGGLFGISLREDLHGKSVGATLHLTVRPAAWWREKILRRFSIVCEILTDDTSLVWAVGRHCMKFEASL